MQLLPFITFLASATAAAIPAATLEERATCANPSAAALAKAKQAFTAAKIVPDVVPKFDPTLELSVDYKGKSVNFGNTFNTLETALEPNFDITREILRDPATTKYTLIMVDPDAPGPEAPLLSDFLHWIVSDVQPKCVTTQKRKTVGSYMTLTPLSVAPHRYTFLVYRQPPNYAPPTSLQYLPGVRNNFDLAAYVKTAKLEGPVGGNYFREGLQQDLEIITG